MEDEKKWGGSVRLFFLPADEKGKIHKTLPHGLLRGWNAMLKCSVLDYYSVFPNRIVDSVFAALLIRSGVRGGGFYSLLAR